MQLRDKLILFVSLLLAVVLLWAAGSQIDPINAQREEMGLVINAALENAPPSLAFATVAMGAFRGLVVDILWMRADTLKEAGQFFDAKQLADWITVLQPRFAAVWEFQAWNMAYNISVAIPNSQPDQRWRWVRNGYELLRDKGIEKNPKSLQLYRELARIFQHKIGGITDDCHRYYKLQLAGTTHPLIGDVNSSYFEELIAAPQTWEELESDPNVLSILTALRAAEPAFEDRETFAGPFLALLRQSKGITRLGTLMVDPNRYSREAARIFSGHDGDPHLQKLDRFVVAYELRHTWKMDPAFMHELNKKYGPIDYEDPNNVIPLEWRNPDAHAIYWAAMGLSLGAGRVDEEGDLTTNEMNCDRIIIHSLQNLYRRGKYHFYEVVYPPPEDAGSDAEPLIITDLLQRVDDRMLERYMQRAWGAIEKYVDDKGRRDSLKNGYRNFVENAIFNTFQIGHKRRALQLYRRVQEQFPDRPEFQVPLEQFARDRFREEFDSIGIHDATEQIIAALREAYAAYAFGDDDKATGNERFAQKIWDHYQLEQFPEPDSQARLGLAPMDRMRYMAMRDFLNDPRYPGYLKNSFWGRMKTEQPELFERMQKENEKDVNERALQQYQNAP